MERTFFKSWLIMAVCVLTTVLPARASTIAYWRFETSPGFLADSGPNGFTLGNNGIAQLTLPVSGAGSTFQDPIPDTAAANAKAASYTITNQRFIISDAPALTIPTGSGQFTAEAYINRTTAISGIEASTIVAQAEAGGTPANDRSWAFIISSPNAGNLLQLQLSTTGGAFTTYSSGIVLANGTDYYVAVTFDLAKSGAGNKGITFYVLDLASGAPPQIVQVDLNSSTLWDSTSSLTIGAQLTGGGGSAGSRWRGLIDEVRLSNVALEQHDLLAHLPEPATAGVMLFLGLGLLGRYRIRAFA